MTTNDVHIRNFSIIAHIDHGKSTLADRLMQATKAVSEREAKAQFLDSMDLERERGITIKASAVTVMHEHRGQKFMLNFIDTPGHVDFGYEVSRALKACEGALLIVDASQGVEAQTVVNTYLAVEQDVELLPVLNKIDLPAARPVEIAMEVEQVLGLPAEDCMQVSAKTGEGIPELLDAICEKIPGPRPPECKELRALIFDAVYDDYRGVLVYARVFDGRLKVGDKIRMMGLGRTFTVTDLMKYTPKPVQVKEVGPGETVTVVAAIKTLGDVRVGDTITLDNNPAAKALEGYEPPRQMVFCDFYPATTEGGKGSDFEDMRDAMERLSLNDSSFTYQAVHSEALGFGFRCGFLGLLHMDIIQERLEREGGLEIVQTAPTVSYEVVQRTKGGVHETIEVHNPGDLPDPANILEIREPMCKLEVMLPKEFIGDIMKLCLDRRGIYKSQMFVSDTRELLTFEIPLAELIYDFYDKLKGMTSGYGTMDYEVTRYQKDDLKKVDILINGEPVPALALICHKDKAEQRGRQLLVRLKKEIDRHQFVIPLQAAIGGKIIARETIQAYRKDVTAKCYGGDVTRKRKLLEAQKKGKQRMKNVGSVNIPQKAFMAVLDTGE
ncbi:MAG: translation elongation factor 4 [Phycisphaerales bacterium JB040]